MVFSQIGDLRSILPEGVHMLALTATATTAVFKAVKKRLALVDPLVIGISPDRADIKYLVEPKGRINTLRTLLATKLQTHFPKTLIFCKTVSDCVSMYKAMRRLSDKDFTEPPGYPTIISSV